MAQDYLREAMPGAADAAALALRFVLSNPHVSVALSGMSAIEQVEQNVATADRTEPLSNDELARLRRTYDERRRLAELYCTGCKYCMPCPNEVNIEQCFKAMIAHQVYGFREQGQRIYNNIGSKWSPGKRADACVQCGVCEPKCPQNIAIRKQLEQTAAVLGGKN
jgi:predicted aldo/keto reductase-like oxidoreductase